MLLGFDFTLLKPHNLLRKQSNTEMTKEDKETLLAQLAYGLCSVHQHLLQLA
jgi:hypothetical protein